MATTPATKSKDKSRYDAPEPIRLQGWDVYVSEARKPDLILPLPDGTELTIHQPTGKALKRIMPAMSNWDLEGVLYCLLGDDAGRKVLELMEDAPIEALPALCQDVMKAFDIDPQSLGVLGNDTPVGPLAVGESQASSS